MSVLYGYVILFLIGAPANLMVLKKLINDRNYQKSRYHFLLLNLSIADSIVVFIMIPVEIGWLWTNAWLAGNVACKVLQFFRAFGPYSSSLMLIVLSLDRYYAVVRPFAYAFLGRKINALLVTIWGTSWLLSFPQLFIFSVQKHPYRKDFEQCVDFDFFPHKWQEQTYTSASLIFLYGLPLIVIISCYTVICYIMIKRSRQEQQKHLTPKTCDLPRKAEQDSFSNIPEHTEVEMEEVTEGFPVQGSLVRFKASDSPACEVAPSTNRPISASKRRMKKKILNQTLVIIVAFIICWTPYVFMALWYQIDPESADSLNDRVISFLFMFAVSNSVVNPYIYGKFLFR